MSYDFAYEVKSFSKLPEISILHVKNVSLTFLLGDLVVPASWPVELRLIYAKKTLSYDFCFEVKMFLKKSKLSVHDVKNVNLGVFGWFPRNALTPIGQYWYSGSF